MRDWQHLSCPALRPLIGKHIAFNLHQSLHSHLNLHGLMNTVELSIWWTQILMSSILSLMLLWMLSACCSYVVVTAYNDGLVTVDLHHHTDNADQYDTKVSKKKLVPIGIVVLIVEVIMCAGVDCMLTTCSVTVILRISSVCFVFCFDTVRLPREGMSDLKNTAPAITRRFLWHVWSPGFWRLNMPKMWSLTAFKFCHFPKWHSLPSTLGCLKKFLQRGKKVQPLPFLSLLPFSLPSFPFTPFPYPFLSSLFRCEAAPLNPEGSVGECCKLPPVGSGRIPAANAFRYILGLWNMLSSGNDFGSFCANQNAVIKANLGLHFPGWAGSETARIFGTFICYINFSTFSWQNASSKMDPEIVILDIYPLHSMSSIFLLETPIS